METKLDKLFVGKLGTHSVSFDELKAILIALGAGSVSNKAQSTTQKSESTTQTF
jgi:hypothetical protein